MRVEIEVDESEVGESEVGEIEDGVVRKMRTQPGERLGKTEVFSSVFPNGIW